MIQEQQFTPIDSSYWSETGVYQKEYNELYKKHIPNSGSCISLNGELIRAISRLTYEYYNNGNCNAYESHWENEDHKCWCGDDEDCVDCDGTGWITEEVETESEVNEFYNKFLQLIKDNVPNIADDVDCVREIILENMYSSPNQFTASVEQKYTILCDKVIYYVYYVLGNEIKPIPSNYIND